METASNFKSDLKNRVQILFSVITDCVLVVVSYWLAMWPEALSKPQFLDPWNEYNNTIYFTVLLHELKKKNSNKWFCLKDYLVDFKNVSSVPAFFTLYALLVLKDKGWYSKSQILDNIQWWRIDLASHPCNSII